MATTVRATLALSIVASLVLSAPASAHVCIGAKLNHSFPKAWYNDKKGWCAKTMDAAAIRKLREALASASDSESARDSFVDGLLHYSDDDNLGCWFNQAVPEPQWENVIAWQLCDASARTDDNKVIQFVAGAMDGGRVCNKDIKKVVADGIYWASNEANGHRPEVADAVEAMSKPGRGRGYAGFVAHLLETQLHNAEAFKSILACYGNRKWLIETVADAMKEPELDPALTGRVSDKVKN